MEAFLIVGLCITFLRKTGRQRLQSAVYWGIATAVLICLMAGVLLFEVAFNQSFWEAIFSLIAAIFVASLTVHMWRSSRTIKKDIEDHWKLLRRQETGMGAYLAVYLFTVLMISREGIETALLLSSLMFQVATRPMFIGAVFGIVAAATYDLFVDAFWLSDQPHPFLSSYGDFPLYLRHPTPHLLIPRDGRGISAPEQ